MSRGARALVALLQDGELHSGALLAKQLGMTRAGVWKLAGELRGLGVELESVARRGYRLVKPVELLDLGRIRDEALRLGLVLPEDIELEFELDSTSDRLHRAPPPPADRPRLVFAEIQRAGRGRRGRSWIAPFGSGLTFSMGWTFTETPAGLSSLSLAIGAALVRCLRDWGADQAMLKWPNDLLVCGRKLGGLLIQLRAESGAGASAVIGLGLNLQLSEVARAGIEGPGVLPVADLAEALHGSLPGRNALAASLASAMLEALQRFAAGGFDPFLEDWRSFDALRDAPVTLVQGEASIEGVARGADRDGALLLETVGRLERFYSGDVSLRPSGAVPR
jgi:BirA family biotin operon repressor/biotin-[acetyl-CoA-carboxylase] ligase